MQKRMVKKSDCGMELQSCIILQRKEHKDSGKRKKKKNLSKQKYNDYGSWILASSCKSHTGLFISPSRISELDCATTKIDTAERSISIGREYLQVFFVLGAFAYFQVPQIGGSREEKWRSQ